VVGSVRSGIGKEISEGFRKSGTQKLEIDGVEIEIKEIDDRGDPREAEGISLRLAKASDTLLVVGHIASTVTKQALPNYMRAIPPIPVILTTETNPDLLPTETSRRGGIDPIFRLSPTDDAQAKAAAMHAISKGGKVFWVVEDTSNSVYSKYLALEFIRTVQQQGKAVVLWSTNSTPPSVETFKALEINCVFFTGRSSDALILIRQIKAFSKGRQMPMIILSDASVDRSLVEQGKGDVEGVYLTHPLKASEYKGERYRSYGKDAYAIVEKLVKDANDEFAPKMRERRLVVYWVRQLLNMHRVHDARLVIGSVMSEAVTKRTTFDGTVGQYIFKDDGTRDNADFRVWQVKDGEFKDMG
jgi:branched-chain amino acid transport system substrate-binding protein